VTRAAAAIAVLVLATSCGGGKPARTAADVIPMDATTVVSLPSDPEQPLTRRALALLPGGARLQTLLDRTGWARAAGGRVEVALFPKGGVGFLEAKLDKSFPLPHVRVRGWTAFALRGSLLDDVRHAKHHLDETQWYARGLRALGPMEVTAVRRDVAFGADGGTVRRATPGGGTDGEPLLGNVPSDAVAAVGAADARALAVAATPFTPALERGVGVSFAAVAAAAPAASVVFVRSGLPVPGTTLVARDAAPARLHDIVSALAGGRVLTEPATLDDRPATLASLTALDVWFGRSGRTGFLTDDAEFHLEPSPRLRPAGLPEQVSSFTYLDVARGLPALSQLAALAGTHLSASYRRRVAGLATVLEYRTHTARATRLTVVVA
jgi:hypothetical protein